MSDKQDATDNSLDTTDKTIPGAINEINSNLTVFTAHTTTVTTTGSGYVQLTVDYNIPTTSKIVGLTSYGNSTHSNVNVITPWQQLGSANWVTRVLDMDGNPIGNESFAFKWLQID